MKYYRLKDDIEYPNRWYLGDILDVDGWELLSSVPKIDNKLDVELYQDGDEMDFTLSDKAKLIKKNEYKVPINYLTGYFVLIYLIQKRFNDCL